MYSFSFFYSTTSFSRRKMCWTRQRSGHRSTHMLTLCGLGVSQHSWLSLIPTMPRFFWPEEVRDYGFSCGAASPACRFPMPASKFTAGQGFTERFSCRNHLKAWRETPPSCCALGASGTGLQGWPDSKSIAGKSDFLKCSLKVNYSVPDPSKEKTPGSFFLGSELWLLLQRRIFSASRRKGAEQWCLRGLIIYHTAQTLDYQYSYFFQCGHLLLYVLIAAGRDKVVLLWDTRSSAGMPLILLHTQPKVRAQTELSAANQWVHAIENTENTVLFSLFYGLLVFFFRSQG